MTRRHEYTTVALSIETRKKLDEGKGPNETYDDVIRSLLGLDPVIRRRGRPRLGPVISGDTAIYGD